MCYKVSTPKKYLAEAAYQYAVPYEDWNSSHELANGFAHPHLPAIVKHNDEFRFIDFEFSLLPKWCTPDKIAVLRQGTLNAKSETVFDLPSFRTSILSKRCLIIVDGIYESHTLNKSTKIPYLIGLKDRDIFALAGIWDAWKHPETGVITRSCSILTTIANPLMARIHNKVDKEGKPDPRMPVILPPELEKEWLDTNLKREDIIQFLKPYPEELLKAHPVSKLANSVKENPNVPEVKLVYDYQKEGYVLPV
ncbi:MAG: SOS response-associated peptidase [Opitutaceae bacterium]|nr:SOS response-associated peptidase [Cytophagales bacterium]